MTAARMNDNQSHDPVLHVKLDSILARLDRIDAHLIGEPGSTDKGLVVRVDRLEQSESRRLWAVRAAVGAALGAVVTAIGAILR